MKLQWLITLLDDRSKIRVFNFSGEYPQHSTFLSTEKETCDTDLPTDILEATVYKIKPTDYCCIEFYV